jgi:hypothetical protein
MELKQVLPTQKKRIHREDGYHEIRVFHRAKKGEKGAAYTFKCGCIGPKVEVYYGNNGLEINGVDGSIESWRKVLLPLLEIKETRTGFEDTHPLLRLRKKYPKGVKKL